MAGETHLVFQAGGRRIAVPLTDLVGIAQAHLSVLPLAQPAHLGLMPHQGTLYPVLDPLVLLGLGQMRSAPALVVLLEVEGQSVGLACQRVEGAAPLDDRPGFASHQGHEEVVVAGWPAVRPNLHRLLGEDRDPVETATDGADA